MTPQERADRLNQLVGDSATGFDALTDRQVEFAMDEVERITAQLTDIIVQNSGEDGKVKRQRAQAIIDSLDDIEQRMGENLLETTEESVRRTTNYTAQNMEKAFKDSQVPTMGMHFDRISDDTFKYVIERYGEDGLILSDRVWRFAGDQKHQLDKVIRGGILQGKSLSGIRRDVRQVHDNSKYNIDRLIRTEMNTAYRATKAHTAEQSSLVDYLKIIRGIADQPHHKCTILSEEDRYGQGEGVFKTDDPEIYNPHPNCTSRLEFVVKDPSYWELLDDGEDMLDETEFEDERDRETLENRLKQIYDMDNVPDIQKKLQNDIKGTQDINLKKFDLDYAKDTAFRLEVLHERYPEVFENSVYAFGDIQYINREHVRMAMAKEWAYRDLKPEDRTEEKITAQAKEAIRLKIVKTPRTSAGTLGSFRRENPSWRYDGAKRQARTIGISPGLAGDHARATDDQKRMHKAGWQTTDKAAHTVTHEFGHAIHHTLGMDNNSDFDLALKDVYKREMSAAKTSGNQRQYFKDNLSEYGFSNHAEVFAEGFAEYYEMGDEARPLAKELGQLAESHLTRRRGQ